MCITILGLPLDLTPPHVGNTCIQSVRINQHYLVHINQHHTGFTTRSDTTTCGQHLYPVSMYQSTIFNTSRCRQPMFKNIRNSIGTIPKHCCLLKLNQCQTCRMKQQSDYAKLLGLALELTSMHVSQHVICIQYQSTPLKM